MVIANSFLLVFLMHHRKADCRTSHNFYAAQWGWGWVTWYQRAAAETMLFPKKTPAA
ncbi:hypothetical protein [Lampropedia puyangensis]|uniref:hypothetical protein n=1 Tax=Lampropedia puyangensis TaxID=1330072 RepID=UPI0013050BB4|nr:hypothetical protein [Lampropedia puyangensis]